VSVVHFLFPVSVTSVKSVDTMRTASVIVALASLGET
jgi:hypothetical protein